MTNKKLRLPLFLAASFLLIGCSSDTIVARPDSWINDKIFVEAGDKDNKMKAIYDAVKSLGDTNSNVLNSVMYKIAKTHIGKFTKDSATDTELTLTDIVTKAKDGNYYKTDEFKKFVDSHPKYKAEDESAKVEGDKVKTVKITGDNKYKVSLNKIINQYEEIEENIYEKLFDDIKGGSYSLGESKLFDEEDYYQHLKKELYHPADPSEITFVKGKAFYPKDKDQSWKQYVDLSSTTREESIKYGYLNVLKLDEASGERVSTGIYDNYIKDKILPDLYKTYLTQTYVKEQRTSSLGRSYARKVNMVTIPLGTEVTQKGKILDMANYFAQTYITGNKDEFGKKNVEYNFELFNKAMSGFVGTGTSGEGTATKEYELLTTRITGSGNFDRVTLNDTAHSPMVWQCYTNDSGAPTFDEGTSEELPTGETTHVFKGTKLGELVEKYSLIFDLTPDESGSGRNFKAKYKQNLDENAIKAYNDITNNGAYSIATGMAIKEKEARLLDMTKDGWFLKNGGLTDLDTTFRDKLFNIKTSTIIDEESKKKEVGKFTAGDNVKYYGNSENTQLAKAFLVKDGGLTAERPWESVVLQGSSNLYIVEVEEAVNTSKMSIASNQKSYYVYKAKNWNDEFETAKDVDKITNEIVKANSSSDTYKKNANEYYLMISNIIFYDQSVYDYFKSQFPDLFK